MQTKELLSQIENLKKNNLEEYKKLLNYLSMDKDNFINPITMDDYKRAMFSQSACNTFALINNGLYDTAKKVFKNNKSLKNFETNPIIFMYVYQLYYLICEGKSYSSMYNTVDFRSKNKILSYLGERKKIISEGGAILFESENGIYFIEIIQPQKDTKKKVSTVQVLLNYGGTNPELLEKLDLDKSNDPVLWAKYWYNAFLYYEKKDSELFNYNRSYYYETSELIHRWDLGEIGDHY